MKKLIAVENLVKHFPISSGGLFRRRIKILKAVDGINFTIEEGTSFAIAGESGSGKTTVAKLILNLEDPTSGSILFEGRPLRKFKDQDFKRYCSRVQTVFQDASSSLNPRMRVGAIVAEPLQVHHKNLPKRLINDKVGVMLQLVGLSRNIKNNFPHELSGGQKQRVAIARAIVLDPSLVILDEPVSSLDVSIQAQILNLLADIQEERKLTYLIIAHDLAMLKHVSSVIGIMYLGKIVEMGNTEQVYRKPLHPYTKALFLAMPRPEPRRVKNRPSLLGEIGSALDLPSGCRFYPRCEIADSICREAEPALIIVEKGHEVACHKVNG